MSTRAISPTVRPDLWDQLAEYAFDPPGVLRPMSVRLAEEHGWTQERTSRVVEEYRRFLFLTAVAGHVVCPSEDVDAAWHEHLTWTRLYWDGLCEQILGRPLHHDPSGGGSKEFRKHWAMYERTLASYERVFHEPPPADIWPAAEQRFAKRQVSWQAKGRRWARTIHERVRRMTRPRTAAIVLTPVLAAGLGPLDWDGPTFLKMYLPLTAVTIAASLALRFGRRIGDRAELDDRLSASEAACLVGGPPAAVNAAVARLLQEECLTSKAPKGFLTKETPTFHATGPLPADADAVAEAVFDSASQLPRTLSELQRATEGETREMVQDLTQRGYLADDDEAFTVRLWPFVLLLAVLALGGLKMAVGLARGKPVIFLVLIGIAIAGVMMLVARRPRMTTAGSDAVASLKKRFRRSNRSGDAAELPGAEVAMVCALYGAVALSGGTFESLRRGYSEMSSSSGWTGDSSGCSGSSCGSGCGGGGGCGGCSG